MCIVFSDAWWVTFCASRCVWNISYGCNSSGTRALCLVLSTIISIHNIQSALYYVLYLGSMLCFYIAIVWFTYVVDCFVHCFLTQKSTSSSCSVSKGCEPKILQLLVSVLVPFITNDVTMIIKGTECCWRTSETYNKLHWQH